MKQLPDHQSSHANLPKNRRLTSRTTELDKPTRWNSLHDIAESFLKQQQSVHAVQTENQKKWHLMPKNIDILESLK